MLARSEEGTCDADRCSGVDSEWQRGYLLHSSLGDSFTILDGLLWNDLARVKPDPWPECYRSVFTRFALNYG